MDDYPIFVLIYWFILWGIFMAYVGFNIFISSTQDYKYIERTDCLEQNKKEECVKYTESYFVPVEGELRNSFIQSGILIGFVCIGFGVVLAYKNRHSK